MSGFSEDGSVRKLVRSRWHGALVAVAVGVLTAAPGGLQAQLSGGRRSNERVLVLPPIPVGGSDSALAVTFASELRDRMESKYRFKLRIIPTETICEALEASGFNCNAILPPENGNALARFLQASGYIVGWFDASDSLRVTLRLVDNARSGLSGWIRFAAATDRGIERFARDVSDGLDDNVKAAEFARQCNERRERSDFRGARDRADKAFNLYRDHPSSAMCLALLFEVQQQPPDSMIGALQRAVEGDSLNDDAWEMLGRRLLDAGDTAGGVDAFEHQLRADPNNIQLRHGIAGAFIQAGRYQDAADLLEYALERNPLDLPTLQLKARACVEGAIWQCALDALSAEYPIDSSLAGDTVFFQRVIGAAQALENQEAMLQWSGEAVEKFPNVVSLWRARAASLKAVDDRDGALAAYDHILGIDSTQIASALAAAQLLLDSTLVIDTITPLDTARLLRADTLLQLVSARSSDTATSMNVAALYYNPGSRIAQTRLMPHLLLAAHLLEQAIAHDLLAQPDSAGVLRGNIATPANFFLGLAYFFNVTELDTQVRESESCELAEVEAERVAKARAAMEAGRSISEQTATQILEFIGRYEEAVKTYPPAWECP